MNEREVNTSMNGRTIDKNQIFHKKTVRTKGCLSCLNIQFSRTVLMTVGLAVKSALPLLAISDSLEN